MTRKVYQNEEHMSGRFTGQQKEKNRINGYVIMHGDQKAAALSATGISRIYRKKRMPFDLYLEEAPESDIDVRIQNLDNFYHWCASRVLTLDRKYAKEILNSIGASQAVTDRDRANIALSYHCLTLTDIFWVRKTYEKTRFQDINLYQNHLETSFVDVALRGKQMTIENSHLIADDLGTSGVFPKAWVRKKNEFFLYKDGEEQAVRRELLASKICCCFQLNQVVYQKEIYDGQQVSASRLITSLDHSIVTWESFSTYLMNHDCDPWEFLMRLDGYGYHMMNLIDYLIGNTDRHWGNWGILIDNRTNTPVRLYDLMDFNRSFEAYDTMDGAVCLPARVVSGRNISQREAAEEAVKNIGLNQISRIPVDWFEDKRECEMFFRRLDTLKCLL